MADKKYTIAGTSTHKGVLTYRFATGKAKVREGVLKRGKHTDITLFDLPKPMTKDEAAAWLVSEKGITAVIPTGRKAKTPLTAEQIKEKKETARKEASNKRKREARAAKKAQAAAPAAPAAPETAAPVTQDTASEAAATTLIDATAPAEQKVVDEAVENQ